MKTVNIKSDWIRCPTCGSKTRNKIREDTVSVVVWLTFRVERDIIGNKINRNLNISKSKAITTHYRMILKSAKSF